MQKALFTLSFFVGLLGYLGIFSYQKVIDISFASGAKNYYTGSKNALVKNVMTLKSCDPGAIPAISFWKGTIEIEPRSVNLDVNGQLRIVNGDSTPHTIGITGTKIWESINPGDSIEFKYSSFPKPGDWGIVCDGINLGMDSPSIGVLDPI